MFADDIKAITIKYDSLDKIQEVAGKIIEFAADSKVWIFEGEMGAGKTTLIKTICEALGVDENVTSPTFSIVNEYQTNTGESLFHFDFYRIKDEHEAFDIGSEDYFYSGNYCFIEWPSKVPSLLPSSYIKINIEALSSVERIIEISKHENEI